MNSSNPDAITPLKAEWDSLQPLSEDNEARLWKKLRLEWDYHSNHIEGNTLTYGETELLVIFGETRGNHTIREYEEMKAHDVAVGHVRTLAQENRDLTEADIRELNQIILKEPFWKAAITPDGASTQKQIFPGQYKSEPNNVRTATGEIFRFADPLDVPHRMHEYVQLINAKAPDGVSFLFYLAKIHHEFLLIHPFDDGNGRVGRLLLNYLLLKLGFPPIIIRTEEKSLYLSALRLADTEQRDYSELARFLDAGLQSALALSIKAAKGESIEEPSDIEKEIAIYAAEKGAQPPIIATNSIIKEAWNRNVYPLLEKIEVKSIIFRKLFSVVELQGALRTVPAMLLPQFAQGGNLQFSLHCEHYNVRDVQPFNVNFPFVISFRKYDYEIRLTPLREKTLTYSEFLTSNEMDEIIATLLKAIYQTIRNKAEKKS